MLFNSIEFFFFFPLVTFLFFVLPHKYRWFLLLFASCFFYSWFIPVYLLILFGTIIIDFYSGIYIEKSNGSRKKLFLIISLFCNIGILAYFKYYNFFIENVNNFLGFLNNSYEFKLLSIALPIGLSFHTFQAMSYIIEVYRGNQIAEKKFGYYALYVLFYPQLVAGPIERPQNVLPQFHEVKYFDKNNVTNGLRLMLLGFFKKVVIADRISVLTDLTFQSPESYSSLVLLVSALLFSFQIYCDFSGYSDIAIGAARVMGFELMKNFNNPYASTNISQFWAKWHISLSTWFRDYLYIPLGGNKFGKLITIRNIFIVFLLSGLWHGANWTFLIWGGLHGSFLIIYNLFFKDSYINKKYRHSYFFKTTSQIFLYLLVSVSWIFFRANNLTDAFFILSSVPDGLILLLRSILVFNFPSDFPVSFNLIFLSVFFVIVLQSFEKYKSHFLFMLSSNSILRWMVYYLIVFTILFFGVFEDKQFIYFQF